MRGIFISPSWMTPRVKGNSAFPFTIPHNAPRGPSGLRPHGEVVDAAKPLNKQDTEGSVARAFPFMLQLAAESH